MFVLLTGIQLLYVWYRKRGKVLGERKMPKKSKGQNAFYYFMLDWRQREERRGRKFANLREVQAESGCSDEWKSLSALEKKAYENMAKQDRGGGMKKQTNCGESLSLVQKQKREEAEFKENMLLYVTSTISKGLNDNTLNGTKFYFIHCNWFYVTEGKEPKYAPAEYAIGEFSLQNGIERFHHKLVHIKPELGYAWEAIETSRNYHKIPYELPQGEENFYNMYMDVIEFLKPAKINGKYPPFFTGKKVCNGVRSLLRQLTDAVDQENPFIVYSVELLFTKFHKVTLTQCAMDENDPLVSGTLDAVGEAEFLKEKFAFEKNIECDYHKYLDGTSQYCSLSVIRQWAYTICDYCCEPFGVKRIPGIHYPEREYEDDISASIMSVSLNNTRCSNMLSMTGVSNDHRQKVSERTAKEELMRRKEAKELQIIDYSKPKDHNTSASSSVAYERPLRPPNTKSFAVAAASGKQSDIPDFGDMNFPTIGGRGVPLKKKPSFSKQSGRGHGSC